MMATSGWPFGVGGSEFAAGQKRLMNRSEVARRDARLLEVHILFF